MIRELPLVLGTAQLGFRYGINNKIGQPDFGRVVDIIRTALDCGINEFDTAQGYGNSEEVLGKVLKELNVASKVEIVSKFDPKLDHLNEGVLSAALDKTLAQLGVKKISCIMLHNEKLISLFDKGLLRILNNFVKQGRVSNIGVSVYSPQKAMEAMDTDLIKFVQVPGNMLDRRFEDEKVFSVAAEKTKNIYIRSIFLQGLILMGKEDLPKDMKFASDVVGKVCFLSEEFGISRDELAMLYVKAKWPDARIIFGAETALQVKKNVNSFNKEVPDYLCQRIEEELLDIGINILNPSLWLK